MSVVIEQSQFVNQEDTHEVDVLVVGAGPVGIYFINELLKRSSSVAIKVFGGEPWEPYNRVRLTDVLSGKTSKHSIFKSEELPDVENLQFSWNNPICQINNKQKYVVDEYGDKHFYKKLVLALGSKPSVPDILGTNLKNVYTFRDLSEAESLMGRQVSSRCTVVIGGGLLGIEAAKAMQRFNTKVVCIEHSTRLMFNQLDDDASRLLEQYLEDEGIQTRINQRVTEIVSDDHSKTKVSAIKLSSGEVIACDTVIISTGIKPNIELVRRTGINIGRGISVNDSLETSVKDVFAIGECAEHDEKIFGLVSPGFEQAAVLAENLSGGKAYYQGSTTVTQLKVLDYPIYSMGETGINALESDQYTYADPDNNVYRKIVVINNRIRGVVALGDWSSRHRIQEAIEKKRYLWFWKTSNFKSTGELWNVDDNEVINWPASATVCNCMRITRGELGNAIAAGNTNFESLCNATGASSVCGSCRPLIQQLAQSNEPVQAEKGSRPLWIFSLISLLCICAFYLLPSLPYAESVQSKISNIDSLWRTGFYKQISGFTLLGLSVIILMLSLRKRLTSFNWGDFPYWRVVHVGLGVLIFAVIFLHTGFRFGNELNFILMMTFSALMLVGIVASTVIAKEHQLSNKLSVRILGQIRRLSIWTHILLFWPIPALLAFHIIKGYYF